MHAVMKGGRGLKVLALALAGTNLILWYAVPWLRDSFDALTGRLAPPHPPMIMTGVQELLVYYDPWLARGVFPAVYTLGFVAIACLFQPARNPPGGGTAAAAVLLLSFEAVWVFLVAFAILCRGPNWNFYWPWEAWVPKLVLWNGIHFSHAFWRALAGLAGLWETGTPWFVREAPGLLLAAGYLSLGLLIARTLSRGAGHSTAACCFALLMLFALAPLCLRTMGVTGAGDFGPKVLALLPLAGQALLAGYLLFRLLRAWEPSRAAGHPMAYWRAVLLVFLVQAAALVPVKVLLYWAFNLKYFLYIPEYFLNV